MPRTVIKDAVAKPRALLRTRGIAKRVAGINALTDSSNRKSKA